MSVLNEISFYQNRRDEVPNQELAKKLAQTRDTAGIREIAEHLWDKNANVRSDCLKVLYETGYLAPELIAEYVDDFIKLTSDKNNRLVWGAMIALSTISALKPEACLQHLDALLKIIDEGSVITQDAGIIMLAGMASAGEPYASKVFPNILAHFEKCSAKYIANRAEHVAPAVTAPYRVGFTSILEKRLPELSSSMAARVRKLLNRFR
jgi:hypothetical protein